MYASVDAGTLYLLLSCFGPEETASDVAHTSTDIHEGAEFDTSFSSNTYIHSRAPHGFQDSFNLPSNRRFGDAYYPTLTVHLTPPQSGGGVALVESHLWMNSSTISSTHAISGSNTSVVRLLPLR
eukprot:6184525-Pleurochrysis_carterae.AAC.3